jgi:putative ABC transport system permease protein
MLRTDLVRFAFKSLVAYRMRAFLSALGICIGIAAVVLLTSIGEGIHQFVLSEFTQFGTNLIGVTPGQVKTAGAPMGILGTVHPLTIDDAEAIHQIPSVLASAPIVYGNAEVGAQGHRRRTMIYGVGSEFPQTLRMEIMTGRFLPSDNPHAARSFAVLGSKVKKEIFGENSPLGQRLEIGGSHYTIIGVMASKGQVFGVDLDDTVYLPIASGMELFNRDGLMEIHVTYDPNVDSDTVAAAMRRLLISRHGRDDFTVTPQKESLKTLDSVLSVLTFAIAGLGSISIVVGAIGILSIMIIAVAERTSEIGLLKALGTTYTQIMAIFIVEAILIAFAGGIGGIGIGLGIARLLGLFLPSLPVHTSWTYVIAAELMAVVVGLIAGVLPARSAARLEPVHALRTE